MSGHIKGLNRSQKNERDLKTSSVIGIITELIQFGCEPGGTKFESFNIWSKIFGGNFDSINSELVSGIANKI